MKKLAVSLTIFLLLLLLLSCGNGTSDSSVSNITTSAPSTTVLSSSTKPQDTETLVTTTSKATETQVTSTSMATETQPISTSEEPQTDPTIIRAGFVRTGSYLLSSPLEIAYEMPKSCSLSKETVTITLYFGMQEGVWDDYILPEDYFEIFFRNNLKENLFLYPLRTVTMTEVTSQNYTLSRKDNVISFSHSEIFEIPLSVFSEERGTAWWVQLEYYRNNINAGCQDISISYEKINGDTIVFYPY